MTVAADRDQRRPFGDELLQQALDSRALAQMQLGAVEYLDLLLDPIERSAGIRSVEPPLFAASLLTIVHNVSCAADGISCAASRAASRLAGVRSIPQTT